MAITTYDYWGDSDVGVLATYGYYTEPELINLAFKIGAIYKNYNNTPDGTARSLFHISEGSITPGNTYYTVYAGPSTLVVGVGDLTTIRIAGLDSEEITGIGTYRTTHLATGCLYDSPSTGVFTPVLGGYSFAPEDLTSTQTSFLDSFTASAAAPAKATTPAPANTATDITLDQATLTWVDGGGATSYNVYYGDTSGALTLVSGGQAGLSLTVTGITLGSPYAYAVTRYWRIDSVNATGTTTGDEWSFTTINFDQLRISYVLITGGSGAGPYDTPPGVEGTDWRYTGENNLVTLRRLVAAANGKIWIEEI